MSSTLDQDLFLERSQRRSARVRLLVLLVFLLLAVAGGLVAVRVWGRFSQHWQAAWQLQTLEMRVTWEPSGSSWWVGASSVGPTNRMAGGGAGAFPPFSDASIPLLRRLDHLETLDLSRCVRVTDSGLQGLAGIESLKEITLGTSDARGPAVTDQSLAFLETLPHLKIVSLANTGVTDSGLVHLKGLNELELVDLDNTLVTDAGLDHLRGLPRLKYLSLIGTKVTGQGVLALMQARPDLEVVHEGRGDGNEKQGASAHAR
jgi:hypothetical protein